MYLTIIDKDYEGDRTFPDWEINQWETISNVGQDCWDEKANEQVCVEFIHLKRKKTEKI